MCFLRISDFQYCTKLRRKAGRINCNVPALAVVVAVLPFILRPFKMIEKTSINAITVEKEKKREKRNTIAEVNSIRQVISREQLERYY